MWPVGRQKDRQAMLAPLACLPTAILADPQASSAQFHPGRGEPTPSRKCCKLRASVTLGSGLSAGKWRQVPSYTRLSFPRRFCCRRGDPLSARTALSCPRPDGARSRLLPAVPLFDSAHRRLYHVCPPKALPCSGATCSSAHATPPTAYRPPLQNYQVIPGRTLQPRFALCPFPPLGPERNRAASGCTSGRTPSEPRAS
ncbi:hypothetical protein EV126DRAFT_425275 [Verticillium dahliae]|nr:hypothetical protein EV126DRAFT_425275 [Verticillium dahliae]